MSLDIDDELKKRMRTPLLNVRKIGLYLKPLIGNDVSEIFSEWTVNKNKQRNKQEMLGIILFVYLFY